MQFTITALITGLLAATALAAPSPAPVPEFQMTKRVENIVLNPDLDIGEISTCFTQCAAIIGAAGCIAGAVSTVNIEGLLKCAATGQANLCACGKCVGIDQFLKDNGVCPAA